jgi:hypothetical protein
MQWGSASSPQQAYDKDAISQLNLFGKQSDFPDLGDYVTDAMQKISSAQGGLVGIVRPSDKAIFEEIRYAAEFYLDIDAFMDDPRLDHFPQGKYSLGSAAEYALSAIENMAVIQFRSFIRSSINPRTSASDCIDRFAGLVDTAGAYHGDGLLNQYALASDMSLELLYSSKTWIKRDFDWVVNIHREVMSYANLLIERFLCAYSEAAESDEDLEIEREELEIWTPVFFGLINQAYQSLKGCYAAVPSNQSYHPAIVHVMELERERISKQSHLLVQLHAAHLDRIQDGSSLERDYLLQEPLVELEYQYE